MATINVDTTADAQMNPYTGVRQFYAEKYKAKKLTDDELSAAVVANVVNCLPRLGGIETSRWAPENNPDKTPPDESVQKISPKKGFQKKRSPKYSFAKNISPKNVFENNSSIKNIADKNGSPKDAFDKSGLSKKASEKRISSKNISDIDGSPRKSSPKNGSRNNRFFKRKNFRNDPPQGETSLMTLPLDPKSNMITARARNPRGTNPLAQEFTPSGKQKSPVVAGGLATSIHAVEALDLDNTRAPSPLARSPDWAKKTKGPSFRHKTPKPVSLTNQNSFVPPRQLPTFKEAIKPKYVSSAKINDSAVNTTGPLSFAHAESVTGLSQSENSEAATKQASSLKDSSPSSGASAWKNHRAIIEQNDKALSEECTGATTATASGYQRLPFKDKWIPAVIEDGCRTFKKAITLTVGAAESHAALLGSNDASSSQTPETLRDPNISLARLAVDKEKRSAFLIGHVLCGLGELADKKIQDRTGTKAEASGVEISETNTGEEFDTAITREPTILKSNTIEFAADEKSEFANGNTSMIAVKIQIQDQYIRTSSLETNTVGAVPTSSCAISDKGDKLEDSTTEKPELTTGEKAQDDPDNHVAQRDAQTSYLPLTIATPETSRFPGRSITSNGEEFPIAPSSAIVDINPEIDTPTKSGPAICQIYKDGPKTSNAVMNSATEPPVSQGGKIATSWDEFTCGRGKPAVFKSYRFQTQLNQSKSSSNIVSNDFGAQVHQNSKGGTQVQDCKVATSERSENHSDAGTLKGEHDISARTIDVHFKEKPVMESEDSSPVDANVYPPAVLHNNSNRAKCQNELESPAQVHAALLKEIIDQKSGNDTVPLTRSNLMEGTGGAPLETDYWGIDKAVSDDGVEGRDVETQNYDIKKQESGDIRNLLVREQLSMDLWEGDRAEVDLSYMPAYIKSWASNIPMIPEPVDTTCDEFKTGLSALSQLEFEKPIAQPLCYPDVAGSENVSKARIQTAEIDCKQYMRESIKKQRRKDRAFTAQVAYNSTLFHNTPHVDPNTPTISCHLRPAEKRDVPGITAIYNHYISDSFIPEDQKQITEEEMNIVWATARRESLPFIVAIQGPPLDHNNPYKETVLGFTRADIYYGIAGGSLGRSRYLGVIEFYTHHQYIRKGVGRSLLDRILCITSSSYLQKGGYDWAIPNAYDSAVYNEFSGGGSPRRWHQLLIHRPIEVKDDPDYEWLKDWLQNKFFFFEVGRLRSIARTKPVGAPARWLDVVTFQLEASTPGEFEAFQ